MLFTGNDFVIIDFEGEPQRPISERRIKTSPLRDVAGMIRSFHYASHTVQQGEARGRHRAARRGRRAATLAARVVRVECAAFLRAYAAESAGANFLPQDAEELRILLDAYLLEKAIYELGYELNIAPIGSRFRWKASCTCWSDSRHALSHRASRATGLHENRALPPPRTRRVTQP